MARLRVIHQHAAVGCQCENPALYHLHFLHLVHLVGKPHFCGFPSSLHVQDLSVYRDEPQRVAYLFHKVHPKACHLAWTPFFRIYESSLVAEEPFVAESVEHHLVECSRQGEPPDVPVAVRIPLCHVVVFVVFPHHPRVTVGERIDLPQTELALEFLRDERRYVDILAFLAVEHIHIVGICRSPEVAVGGRHHAYQMVRGEL